jgi:hypothetical protein
MSLFAGAYCGTRKLAFLVPLFFVLLTDCILEATSRIPGFYSGWLATGWGFHSTWWGVYGSVALVAGIGWLLRRRPSLFNIAAAGVVSAVLYFLITNFAEWAVGRIGYPKTWAGLLECYAAALAFYRQTNAPLGDLVYIVVLFGGFALAERYVPALGRAQGSEVRSQGALAQ